MLRVAFAKSDAPARIVPPLKLKPWLWLPPQLAHDLAPWGLPLIARAWGDPDIPQWDSRTWKGLRFPNPLGIAGGVDKNARLIQAWWSLGAGFVEVGTITPKPQGPNSGVILRRDLRQEAVWNRMGFPNEGVQKVARRLEAVFPFRRTPLFVNIGKNRETPLERAADDYGATIETLCHLADALVINVSSPNTPGLRQLQGSQFLKEILVRARRANTRDTPLLLKLSPDLHEQELRECLELSLDEGVSGFICTNTTLQRPPGIQFPQEGGLSGRPLASISELFLKQVMEVLGERRRDLLIVSVGGISTLEDILRRLVLGADLVQVYSRLILDGPLFFKRIAAERFGP